MIDDLRVCFLGDSFVAGVGDHEHVGWSGRLALRSERAGQTDRVAGLDAAFGRECRELGVPYVSVIGPLTGDEVWRSEVRAGDGSHPGDAGYRRLADLVWPTWATWLGLAG